MSEPSSALAPSTGAASQPLFIDVRSSAEFRGGHLAGALNLPLDQLQHGIASLVPNPDSELVLYCASGARSAFGCAVLTQMGYTAARNGGGIGTLALSSQRPVLRG